MKRNKNFYDRLTLDLYHVSSKYRWLRYKNYTTYSQNIMHVMFPNNELRVYEIKLFGKWFIYRIKKIQDKRNIHEINEIYDHVKQKSWDSLGIPPERLTLKQVDEKR